MTEPLLRKSWLETRSRFLAGLVILIILSVGTVYQYPEVRRLLPIVEERAFSGALGQFLKESLDLQREFRGYVWFEWFRQNLAQMVTLFAVLLGSGSLVSHGSAGGALFMLSLPISRRRFVTARAAVGFGELAVLAFLPSLAIPLLAPAIGEHYAVGDVLAHGVCVFFVGAVFFSLALFLSAVFNDLWRPLLIVLTAAVLIGVAEQLIPSPSSAGVFRTMSAERFFHAGSLPWSGLLVSAIASIALLYGAAAKLARRDF